MGKLFDFDNGGGPSTSRIVDLNQSEIVDGNHERSIMEHGSPMKDDINISIDGMLHPKDSHSILMNAPTSKKSMLEPLETAKSIQPKNSGKKEPTVTGSQDFT